jgi:hypothetical protein
MLGLLRSLISISWSLVLLCGWIAFLLLALLLGAEATGLMTSIARSATRTVLGERPISMEHAGVRLFPARLVIHELVVGQAPERIRIDELELEWSLDFEQGFQITGATARGGSAELGRAWLKERSSQGVCGPELQSIADLPLRVEGLELVLASHRWGRLPLGRLDARGSFQNGDLLRFEGRLRPRFSPDGTRTSELYFSGQYAAAAQGLDIELEGAALPLSLAYLPEGQLLEHLRAWQPRGMLDLTGRLSMHAGVRARVRAQVQDADIVLARGMQRLTVSSLELDLALESEELAAALDPQRWTGNALFRGAWEGAQLRGTAELRAGRLAAQLAAESIPLDERIVELAGSGEHLREIWRGFAPRGSANLLAGIDWPLELDAERGLRVALEFDPAGKTGMTYLGWPEDGRREEGFPLPADEVSGKVVFAREPGTLRPIRTGLIDLCARTPAGNVRCDGLVNSHAIDAPPFLPGYGASELDLAIESAALSLGEPIYAALRGLEPSVEAASTWLPFDPRGGTLAARFRLVRMVDMPFAAIELATQLKGVEARWEELPLPVRGIDGELRVHSDGKGAVAVAFEADAELERARALHIAANLHSDPRSARGSADECMHVRVRADELALQGADAARLRTQIPAVAEALEESGARGTLDLLYVRERAGHAASPHSVLELRPRETQLVPRAMPLELTGLAGRVLLELPDEGAVRVRAVPLLARWKQTARIALDGEFDGTLRILAAGLDAGAPELNEQLQHRLGDTPSAVRLAGAFDLEAALEPARPDALRIRAQLRRNSLEAGEQLVFEALEGRLDWAEGRLRGQNLRASLAGSALEVRDLQAGAADGGWELRMQLAAQDLLLDRAHLAGILDASTLDTLLGELALQGRVEIDSADLRLAGGADRSTRLEFSGDITPADTTLELGLPLRIGTARARIEQLILEDEQLRVRARIDELYGDIAGRLLGPASFRLSYVEPLLLIEDLDASLEGGRLLPIGGEQHMSGASFAITLLAPYDFQLGISLRDVEVGGLLRGLFDSEFATKGRLNAELRLEGNTEQLMELEGSGSLRVRDSRLWSIPVFRALFSQLGLDSTVVFENMQSRLRIADGRIVLTDMSVESPILQLVGSRGTLDFDGALSFDLELRYALIDRLGPFTRLFYSIQNRLMSVEIRGDMARPFVDLKNPITGLFRGRRHRALPLPGLSPLPTRF